MTKNEKKAKETTRQSKEETNENQRKRGRKIAGHPSDLIKSITALQRNMAL